MRALVVLLLAVAAVCALALPALGHARLVGTAPADGATVSEAPTEVRLEFNEPVEADFGQLQVRAPDDERVDAGMPDSEGPVVRVELEPLTVAGTYTVSWRVISADGHPVEGTFSFDVADDALAEPEPTPTPEATPTQPGPTPAETPGADLDPTPDATAEPSPDAELADAEVADDGGTGLAWALLLVVVALAGGAVALLRSGRA